jgi:hypothetical protein
MEKLKFFQEESAISPSTDKQSSVKGEVGTF